MERRAFLKMAAAAAPLAAAPARKPLPELAPGIKIQIKLPPNKRGRSEGKSTTR